MASKSCGEGGGMRFATVAGSWLVTRLTANMRSHKAAKPAQARGEGQRRVESWELRVERKERVACSVFRVPRWTAAAFRAAHKTSARHAGGTCRSGWHCNFFSKSSVFISNSFSGRALFIFHLPSANYGPLGTEYWILITALSSPDLVIKRTQVLAQFV